MRWIGEHKLLSVLITLLLILSVIFGVSVVKGGAVPVFGAEGVEREELDSHVGAGCSDFAHSHHALLVSHAAVQSAGFGPASVAVHDDGDVLGNACHVKRFRRHSFGVFGVSAGRGCR